MDTPEGLVALQIILRRFDGRCESNNFMLCGKECTLGGKVVIPFAGSQDTERVGPGSKYLSKQSGAIFAATRRRADHVW